MSGNKVWVVVCRWIEADPRLMVRVCSTEFMANQMAFTWLKSILPLFGKEYLDDKKEVQWWAKQIEDMNTLLFDYFVEYVQSEGDLEIYEKTIE